MSKTVYGQAFIQDDSLVQETITFTEGQSDCTNGINTIIPNIWTDLMSASGEYKFNDRKNYFYWEYDMTSLEDDDITVKVNFNCPQPKEGLLTPDMEDSEVEGEWAKYWLEKIKTATENAENSLAIQRKEVTFPGTSYIKQDGEVETIDDYVFRNNDLGDITNLLRLF